MANPILMVTNAGTGITPACPEAKFSPGDVVQVRRLRHLRHLPEQGAVAVMVPPGFPPEWAMADARGELRPLMTTQPHRTVTYVVAFEGDRVPHLLRESDLKPTGLPKVQVGWTTDAKEDAHG